MIIKVMGGLGNQMFQYALYKKLLMLGKDVSLDDRGIACKGNQHNGLELKRVFGLKYRRISRKDSWRYFLKKMQSKAVRTICRKAEDKYFLYDNLKIPFEKIKNGKYFYLSGFWQNGHYFEDIRDELLSDFRFAVNKHDHKNISTGRSMSEQNSVSVHIRRGDYLQNQDFVYICADDYYKKAMDLMRSRFERCRFYFFTDDIPWVTDKYGSLKDCIIADWNQGSQAYMDMYLMSKCRHNIIAASTFSWWGAWLNKNPDKTVICPEKWYKHMDVNLALEDWMKI